MLTKKYLLIFSILLSNNHVTSSFFGGNPFDILRDGFNFIEKLSQEEQHTSYYNQQTQQPQKQTIYNNSQLLTKYLIQYRKDLAGLPTDEIDEIINQTAQQLQGANLTKSDYVEGIKKSVLIEHSAHKVSREISAYEIQKDVKFDQDLRDLIQDNRQNALIKYLTTLESITGNDIKSFFGDYRKNGIEQVCIAATKKQKDRLNQNQYPIPSGPPAPPAPKGCPQLPPAPPSQSHYHSENTNDYLSQQDVKKLSKNSSLDDIKRELTLLLNKKLEQEEEDLKKTNTYSARNIEQAIEATRTQKKADIKNLKKTDNVAFAKIIGNNCDGASNIKTAVYNNLQKNRN